jgi:hypothetical protein
MGIARQRAPMACVGYTKTVTENALTRKDSLLNDSIARCHA